MLGSPSAWALSYLAVKLFSTWLEYFLVQREHPKFRVDMGVGSGAHKSCQISETVQDRAKVTITD